ncbi:hypothetical protein WJX73_010824 [Symbiochloris irregularis]|uniref:Uncharacterized protein n=1 Tax=Symbiochloris irregularis TaxID=706552 RepID=A0AAW1PV15_9CHLO
MRISYAQMLTSLYAQTTHGRERQMTSPHKIERYEATLGALLGASLLEVLLPANLNTTQMRQHKTLSLQEVQLCCIYQDSIDAARQL